MRCFNYVHFDEYSSWIIIVSFVSNLHPSTSSSQCVWTGAPIRPSWLHGGKLLPCNRKPSDWPGCQPIRHFYLWPWQTRALLHCQPSAGQDTHEHTVKVKYKEHKKTFSASDLCSECKKLELRVTMIYYDFPFILFPLMTRACCDDVMIHIDFTTAGIFSHCYNKTQFSLICFSCTLHLTLPPARSISQHPTSPPSQCMVPYSQCKEKWDGLFVLSFMHSFIFILQSPLFHLHLFICLFVCSQVSMTRPTNSSQPFNIRPQV